MSLSSHISESLVLFCLKCIASTSITVNYNCVLHHWINKYYLIFNINSLLSVYLHSSARVWDCGWNRTPPAPRAVCLSVMSPAAPALPRPIGGMPCHSPPPSPTRKPSTISFISMVSYFFLCLGLVLTLFFLPGNCQPTTSLFRWLNMSFCLVRLYICVPGNHQPPRSLQWVMCFFMSSYWGYIRYLFETKASRIQRPSVPRIQWTNVIEYSGPVSLESSGLVSLEYSGPML